MSDCFEFKPHMLVKCEKAASSGEYEYYLITAAEGLVCSAYKINVNTVTFNVELRSLVTVTDLRERAVAVYSASGRALSPEYIVLIVTGDPVARRSYCLWKREEPPLEVTMSEVCKKFGREVKIVKEK